METEKVAKPGDLCHTLAKVVVTAIFFLRKIDKSGAPNKGRKSRLSNA